MRPIRKTTKAELIVRAALAAGSALLVGVIALVSLTAAWHMWGREGEASAQARAAQLQVADLTAQKEKVAQDLAELRTDRGAEAALRERYGVARDGEGVITVVERDATTSAGTVQTLSLWQRLRQTLFAW